MVKPFTYEEVGKMLTGDEEMPTPNRVHGLSWTVSGFLFLVSGPFFPSTSQAVNYKGCAWAGWLNRKNGSNILT